MTKYEIRKSRWTVEALITPVEVERGTESSVWIKGRRYAKRSEYYNYYDTWQEAKDALQKNAQDNVDSLRRQLERASDALEKIKGMSC